MPQMEDYKAIAEQQYKALKGASKMEDVPLTFLDWQAGRGWVRYIFTGKFRKVQKGEFNRRIANRNRSNMYSYQPEYEFEGKRFPLPIVSLRSVPEDRISKNYL